jgi:GxxExxY protein
MLPRLVRELRDRGLEAAAEVPIPVNYKGDAVGYYYADLLVDGKVICEIKAVRQLLPEHEAQLIHYLKATGTEVGLLLNFGGRSAQIKRLVFTPDSKPQTESA